MSDNKRYPYLKTRLDIMEHVKAGKLIRTKKAVYDWLCYEAAKAQYPGWIDLNAPMIASCIHESKRAVHDAMGYLRDKKYIHYGDNRGKKGPFMIFIDKWEILLHVFKGQDKPSIYIPYRTHIWNKAGEFIGDDLFFARLKVRKLKQNYALSTGFISGLSEHLNGSSSDFKTAFTSDFEEMTQVIDRYMETPGLMGYLSDFTRDYPEDFHRTMKAAPYLNNSCSNTSKDLAPQLSTDIKNDIEGKLTELQGIWDDFNPKQFAGKYLKGGYGKNLPVSLLTHTLRGLIAIKHKTNLNGWGYAQTTIDNEKQRFIGKENTKEKIRMSEHYKKELADWAKEIWNENNTEKDSHNKTKNNKNIRR